MFDKDLVVSFAIQAGSEASIRLPGKTHILNTGGVWLRALPAGGTRQLRRLWKSVSPHADWLVEHCVASRVPAIEGTAPVKRLRCITKNARAGYRPSADGSEPRRLLSASSQCCKRVSWE